MRSDELETWWSLSYASWLTLPRVLMQAMPIEWQDRMATLLNEYDAAFTKRPDLGTVVRVVDPVSGRFVSCPQWLTNYRRPDDLAVERCK